MHTGMNTRRFAGIVGVFALVFALVWPVADAPASHAASPRVVAVGDIACPSTAPVTAAKCQQGAVAKAIARVHPDSLWLLGDIQYPAGALADFETSFGPAFNRFKRIWRPAPGNHEYLDPGAAGYFDFFGRAAGPARRGYYSFDLGRWHVVSLNSNCAAIGGCTADSRQWRWLRSDLVRHRRHRCSAAFWHAPRFSSSAVHGGSPDMTAIWTLLRRRGVDVALSGHDHDFEVFRPQDAHGRLDLKRGIVQFVAGTGGRSTYPFAAPAANSKWRLAGRFGFVQLSLQRAGYAWGFVSESGARPLAGVGRCH